MAITAETMFGTRNSDRGTLGRVSLVDGSFEPGSEIRYLSVDELLELVKKPARVEQPLRTTLALNLGGLGL